MKPRTSPGTSVDGSARHDRVASLATVDRHDDETSAPMLRERRGDVLVIRPLGQLDADMIERVGRVVAGSSTAVIVDLAECVLSDPEALKGLDDTVLDGIDLCIVSGRLSCRRLLARTGATARFAVFQRQEDALQARLLATDGYGRGWSVP